MPSFDTHHVRFSFVLHWLTPLCRTSLVPLFRWFWGFRWFSFSYCRMSGRSDWTAKTGSPYRTSWSTRTSLLSPSSGWLGSSSRGTPTRIGTMRENRDCLFFWVKIWKFQLFLDVQEMVGIERGLPVFPFSDKWAKINQKCPDFTCFWGKLELSLIEIHFLKYRGHYRLRDRFPKSKRTRTDISQILKFMAQR